jgi:16S rRNA (guanine527-N7)-methyltransferase
MTAAEKLAEGIASLGLTAKPETQHMLMAYVALLQKWNKTYNLTAIRNADTAVSNHLLDSLAVLPHLWPQRWLDVGAGAGLPGLVLALMRPEWDFTLLDSNSKKAGFMQQAVIDLGIKNATICCARVEEWQTEEKFDGIISRAFAKTAEFVSLTRHLLAPSGRWAAMKGEPEQELAELPPDVEVQQVIKMQVPMLDAARSLVILKAK